METLKTEVVFKEEASRLEILIRIPYFILLNVIHTAILAPAQWILALIQAAHIIATGKRHKTLHRWIKVFVVYGSRPNYYVTTLVDERPPVIPDILE